MKFFWIIIPLLLLQGCAQMFPAQATKLDSGAYRIQTTANIFASDESMKKKVDKKAEGICQGKGFTELESKAQAHSEQIYMPGMVTTGSYKTFNKTIQCNQSQ
ncbi:hypothetical protein MXM33_01855 [Acinetobacter vivianii]|jgi:hypothetical protein|nr:MULTISPECIES: hypothetical protein [Acinetobacter]KYQ83466.1 hypothetical protein AWW72_14065 [Acinetobacter sp. NRRL B-65365]MEB6665773.1 hypothetical protein [Acinetobacter vivianii]